MAFLLYISTLPSILGATVPRDSLLNFNDVIPGGRYCSSRGSTDSLITIVAAFKNNVEISVEGGATL